LKSEYKSSAAGSVGEAKVDVKEAVALAKTYTQELFVDEKIENLGLEEVEFDDRSGIWSVTIGFSRPFDGPQTGVAAAIAQMSPRKREYKIVRIADADQKLLAVRNRETVR
jgi:hypothetical protein